MLNSFRRHRESLLVALCLALALWLRLRGLHFMEFKWDEKEALQLGMNLLADRPWATAAPWPRAGMLSSNGIANAPLFNSIMALFWRLTHDPVHATALVALSNWLALPALYLWARPKLGIPRALAFLAFLSVSPFPVIYARKLWAQDLLLPGLTLVLYGFDRLRGASFWRGLGLVFLGLLPVTQLHQSGPIFAVVLGLAVPLQWALDKRDGKLRAIARPGAWDLALIAVALGLHAFFVIPYLQYLLTLAPETLANRPKLPRISTDYIRRIILQAVPTDLLKFIEYDTEGFFHDTVSMGRFGWFARNLGYFGAAATGLPLALHGLWHWLKTPRAIPYAGLSWILFVSVFVALRILAHPHYVLILYPLPFLLLAGAFRLPGPEPLRILEAQLPRLRWIHAALLLVLTVSYQNWLWARGGSPGDYGVIYQERLNQADALHRKLAAPTAGDLPQDPTLTCRQIPDEVTFLLRWRAGDQANHPDNAKLCDSWETHQPAYRHYRWQLR